MAGVVLFAGAACSAGVSSRSGTTDAQRAARRDEITAMLARAAANWNRGNLTAFVDDYLPGDETTFMGGRGLLRGTDAIREAYAPRFAAGATRDSLSFVLLDVDPVAPDALHVIATYVLTRRVGGRDSVTARGPTSLLMRRVDGRWRIVHDHSS